MNLIQVINSGGYNDGLYKTDRDDSSQIIEDIEEAYKEAEKITEKDMDLSIYEEADEILEKRDIYRVYIINHVNIPEL